MISTFYVIRRIYTQYLYNFMWAQGDGGGPAVYRYKNGLPPVLFGIITYVES